MWQYDAQLTVLVVFMGLLNVAALQLGTRKLQGRFSEFIAEHGNARAVGLHGLEHVETLKASGLENEFFALLGGHQGACRKCRPGLFNMGHRSSRAARAADEPLHGLCAVFRGGASYAGAT